MKYRIKTYEGKYRVQYRGWATVWLWVTDSWGCYGECGPNDYNTIEDAKLAIKELKTAEALHKESNRVVYEE